MSTMDIELVLKELGREIEQRREKDNRWSRHEMVYHLQDKVGVQICDRTLLAYEHGIRRMPVARLLQLCEALGVSAPAVLLAAIVRADNARCRSCGGAQ